jgi:hypothetical protein
MPDGSEKGAAVVANDSKPEELQAPPDQLNQKIGVLTRREVEARFLAPLFAALSEAFGREAVLAVVRETLRGIARRQGAELARACGGNSLRHFQEALEHWRRGDAMQIEMLAADARVLAFKVTRCRYAEMYRDLGILELGAVLSCDRDFALIEGFNPRIRLSRPHTLMAGDGCCDFRYELPE